MFYVQYDENNNIQFATESPLPDFIPVDFEVVTGYDGKLYEKGKEPSRKEEMSERVQQRLPYEISQLEQESVNYLNTIMKAQILGQEINNEDIDRFAENEAAIKRLRSELAAVGE